MKSLKLLFGLHILVWLSACSHVSVSEPDALKLNWVQQQVKLKQLQQWNIQGKIALQSEAFGGQAEYSWQQRALNDFDIRLQAPLGAGTTWIHSRPQGVSLRNSSGEQLYDTHVDRLMRRVNGWPLPVSGLLYWVRGLPAEQSEYQVTQWNPQGLPRVIQQDGWRIELRTYRAVGDWVLPRKLFINRPGTGRDEQEIDVRLIIRHWQIGGSGEGSQALQRPGASS